jgi:hypothetical protein
MASLAQHLRVIVIGSVALAAFSQPMKAPCGPRFRATWKGLSTGLSYTAPCIVPTFPQLVTCLSGRWVHLVGDAVEKSQFCVWRASTADDLDACDNKIDESDASISHTLGSFKVSHEPMHYVQDFRKTEFWTHYVVGLTVPTEPDEEETDNSKEELLAAGVNTSVLTTASNAGAAANETNNKSPALATEEVEEGFAEQDDENAPGNDLAAQPVAVKSTVVTPTPKRAISRTTGRHLLAAPAPSVATLPRPDAVVLGAYWWHAAHPLVSGKGTGALTVTEVFNDYIANVRAFLVEFAATKAYTSEPHASSRQNARHFILARATGMQATGRSPVGSTGASLSPMKRITF